MDKMVRYMKGLAVAGVAAVAVAACGSSNSHSGGSGGSTTSGASGTTSSASAGGGSTTSASGGGGSFKGTIKVSVVTDVTGNLSVASNMQGALAYFDTVNASGGVDGYKIVPTEYDTQSTPSVAVQAFRRAISANPAAIVGGSFVAGSSLTTLAQSGIPSVGDGFAAGWTGHSTLFPIAGDEATHLSDVLLVVDKKYGNASKIALLGGSIDAADEKNLIGQAPSAGVQLVMKDLSAPLVPTAAQFLQMAEQVKSSGAQGVVALGVENLSQLQIDLNQLGAHVAVITVDLSPATTKENGLIYSDPWAAAYVKNDPGITAYLAAMKKYGYSKLITTTAYGPVRWAQAALLVQALKKAGPPFSHAAVVKALSETKGFTADGVVPKVSYPAFQKIGDNCQVVLKVINGQWVSQINGSYPFVCGGPSKPDPS